MNEYVVFIGIFCFFAGLLIAYLIQGRIAFRKIRESEAEADQCIKESEKKAATRLKEADLEVKDRLLKLKSEFDAETSETRSELKKRESRLIQKEENLDHKTEQLERRDRELRIGRELATMPMARLVEPAVTLARTGFAVSPFLRERIEWRGACFSARQRAAMPHLASRPPSRWPPPTRTGSTP